MISTSTRFIYERKKKLKENCSHSCEQRNKLSFEWCKSFLYQLPAVTKRFRKLFATISVKFSRCKHCYSYTCIYMKTHYKRPFNKSNSVVLVCFSQYVQLLRKINYKLRAVVYEGWYSDLLYRSYTNNSTNIWKCRECESNIYTRVSYYCSD